MKDADHSKKRIVLVAASACALAVCCATLAFDRTTAPVGEFRLTDASSILNLFPPVHEPATIPGGPR